MITVGVLNSLMVLKQILTTPKTLREIREGLLEDQRENRVPFLLRGGLDEYIEDEIRDGRIQVVGGNGTGERYEVNSALVSVIGEQIDSALAQWKARSTDKMRDVEGETPEERVSFGG